MPGLAHSSLISISTLCNNGCTATFTNTTCNIYYNQRLVLTGERNHGTNLWRLPITPTTAPTRPPSTPTTTPTPQQAHNVHTITHIQNRVLKYMHQAFFFPPIQTLLRAAHLGFLDTCPFLDAETISKHLPKSPATAKGRMRLHPKNQRPTPPFNNTPVNANIFCFAALADKNKGTIYTDCTSNLPTRALDNQQLFFVAYHYDINYIFALPIPSTKGDDIIAAFTKLFNDLTAKGFAPTFNVTDNQAAAAIKTFVTSRNCVIQFVEPNNHRVNAAERAIQTFKNHFISGLCTTDINFPLQLWNHLAHQAEITCNLLRRSRLNPHISAYHQLHGHKYNWSAHPLAPPGTRALVLNPPALRTSWGPRAIDAWYCGPAMDHYRCSNFYVPETRSMRITATFELYPTHCSLPRVTPYEHTGIVFNELV